MKINTILALLIVFIMPQINSNKSLSTVASSLHSGNDKPSVAGASSFMKKETWKYVVGFEGFYKVSSEGRVKGVKRVIKYSDGRVFNYPEKVLKSNAASNGYCQVKFGRKWHRVHRLVAIAFLYNPQDKPEVNHINGNKMDNRLCNLEWATKSENGLHSFRYLGRKNAPPKRGNAHKLSKSIIAIFPDGSELKYGALQEAARELNLSAGLICLVLGNKRNHTGGIKFLYAK